jgi:hypothetical protein
VIVIHDPIKSVAKTFQLVAHVVEYIINGLFVIENIDDSGHICNSVSDLTKEPEPEIRDK